MAVLSSLSHRYLAGLLLLLAGCAATPKPLPSDEATVILRDVGRPPLRWWRARDVVWRYERSVTFVNAVTGTQITISTTTGTLIVLEGGRRLEDD